MGTQNTSNTNQEGGRKAGMNENQQGKPGEKSGKPGQKSGATNPGRQQDDSQNGKTKNQEGQRRNG